MARLSEVKLRITDLREAAKHAPSVKYLAELYGVTLKTMAYTIDLHEIAMPKLQKVYVPKTAKGGRRKAKLQELGLV